MKIDEFREKIDKVFKEKEVVDIAIRLCRLKTVSPAGNEFLLKEFLDKWSQKVGVNFEMFEAKKGRTNYIIQIDGSCDSDSKRLGIVLHSDVVDVVGQEWESDPFEPEIRDGNIYARGIVDNKGALAAVLNGISNFLDIAGRDFSGSIVLCIAADEENGSKYGIQYLLEKKKFSCDVALVPDGARFSEITYGEMGILNIEVESVGKEYHGAFPEKGINAIVMLSCLIEKLDSFDWKKLGGDSDFDSTVLNTGKIKGGTANNIVPSNAVANFMWRYPSGVEPKKILEIVGAKVEEVEGIYGGKFKIKETVRSIPYLGDLEDKRVLPILETSITSYIEKKVDFNTIRAETIAKYIGHDLKIPVFIHGISENGEERNHSSNEFLEISCLERFSKVYSNILFEFLKG